MNIIEIKNLSHSFLDGTLGIDGINLSISEGEFIVIGGQNGSGKTTLLKHLNGLLLPTKGAVLIEGVEVSRNIKKARQMVGMVFQNADSQIVGETVYADVAFGPENLCLDRQEIEKRVATALESVGLTQNADKRPHLLSGGEKRRLSIAGILAMEPKVIVFDEPFSGLDYPGLRQVLKQIISLHQSGHTIIITTHDIEKIIAHASRLLIIKDGKVVRDGMPDKILQEAEVFGVRAPCATRLGAEVASWLS
ncbi:MAG: energy-coupling factor ABC transporter ATP-binding protein [Thermodesulfobacteriota bacterium]|nr:energy-coupling factor ABC transporter ATP-binding protein [Thermodesulfobacteriota bacterium]